MTQIDATLLNELIGWSLATTPLLLVAVMSHIKRFVSSLPWTRSRTVPSDTDWAPLVLDFLAIGFVRLSVTDGRLVLPGVVGWPTVILLGLVLGVATGKAYDLWNARPRA